MMVATRRVNEVAEVACRENCSNPHDVTSITTKASRPAVPAVMTTNPGFDGAVKTPCWLIEPAVVFQATVAPVTALPNWSVTTAPKSRVPPTATVVAGASMAIPTGGPATSVAVIVRETLPSVAVSCTEAGVVVMGAWYRMVRPSGVSSKMLPVPVVVHRTSPSGFALPYASRTVAAITDWESTDTLVDVSAMSNVAGAPGTMVTCCLPVLPLEWVAVTKPTPTVVDAVNTPLDVIVPMPPVTPQVSVAPVIALPNRSVAVATNVRWEPAGRLTAPSKRFPPSSMATSIRSSGPGSTFRVAVPTCTTPFSSTADASKVSVPAMMSAT